MLEDFDFTVAIREVSVHSWRWLWLWRWISCDSVDLYIYTWCCFWNHKRQMNIVIFSLISNLLLCNLLPACDSRRMWNGDSAQQAVLRSVQLPVCSTWRRVCWAGDCDVGSPPPGPLLTLRPIQSSHCHCAPAMWSRGPGETSADGGGVQVRDEHWGTERRDHSFHAAVTVLQLLQQQYTVFVILML